MMLVLFLCLLGSGLGFLLLFGALRNDPVPSDGLSGLLGRHHSAVIRVQPGLEAPVRPRVHHRVPHTRAHAVVGGYGGATQALVTLYR
jgi:hypothetical protein